MAAVSIVRDASSEVDVRIAQYTSLYDPDILVKVPGGEEYFAAFNEDHEDDPKESPILTIFKGLNQIVLTSPIMNPYRKTPVPLAHAAEPLKEEVKKPVETPRPIVHQAPVTKEHKAKLPEVTRPEPQEKSWLWLIGLLVISILGFSTKYYFSKRSL
jgi:hypothetical protein